MSKFFAAHALAAATAALLAVPQAQAASTFIDVNLAGWTAVDDFGLAGNSERLLNIGAGSTITGFSYSNLRFTTDAGLDSYQSELVLSVNNADASEFLDWAPSTNDAPGTFGPASGSWNGAAGQPGPYSEGGTFTVSDGVVFVTTYLSYYDTPAGITISSGTLRILYDNVSAVPEPSTYALMAAGLIGVGAAAKRRRAG